MFVKNIKMKHKLDESLDAIKNHFRERNPYAAHLKSHLTLNRMATDDEVIFEIIRRNLATKKFDELTGAIDFQICLFDAPECTFYVTFFGPNPKQDTTHTYSTMHHHDDALLSTINAKGPGYNSLIFKKGFNIDKQTNEVEIGLEKYVPHSLFNIEFIDAQTAHTLFFPKSISMTYALWSNYLPVNRLTKLKSSPFIQKNKSLIKKIIRKASVNVESIGIPQQIEDYFYPENGKIKFLSSQILPPTQSNWIQNYFHIIQFTGFNDKNFLKSIYPKYVEEKNNALPYIEKLIEGEVIERNYENYDFNIDKRNVSIDEYRKCYAF